MPNRETKKFNQPVDINDAATVERLTARARRDAVAIGGRPEDGEDAIEDVFLRCLTDTRPLVSEALFRTVVIRKTRDILRRSRRRKESSLDALGAGVDGEVRRDAAEAVMAKRGYFTPSAEAVAVQRETDEHNDRCAWQLDDALASEEELTRLAIIAYANEDLHTKVQGTEEKPATLIGPKGDPDELAEINGILDLGEPITIEELAEGHEVTWSALYFRARRARERVRAALAPQL